ncbi:MAG: DUF3644 domain-containing protein [Candidatus Thiodiazotropha endolucinida]
MNKQSKILLEKSIDSLMVAITHFNSPLERGRTETVLIMLDRSYELLLKSLILHKGGKTREPYAKETIGHEKCVRKCISDEQVRCLTEEQGLTIQIINSFRDAAQHDIVHLSEQELYMYCQAGVTLYRDLIKNELEIDISDYMPDRVLPISTDPPKDLHTMIEADFDDIKILLRPKSRRQMEAKSRLKSLAIVEASLSGERSQPSEFEIKKLVKKIRTGSDWEELFPGVASLDLSTTGHGINVDIRITKKGDEAVRLVPEGTPGATVLAVKRVNEIDYYSLTTSQLAAKTNLTQPKLLALIWKLTIQDDVDAFKVIKLGKVEQKRYSTKALSTIMSALNNGLDIDEIWNEYKKR